MEELRFNDREQLGCRIVLESRVTPATLEALDRIGHVLQMHSDYTSLIGHGQAILHDSTTGTNFGASNPRADGAAVPEQPDLFGASAKHSSNKQQPKFA